MDCVQVLTAGDWFDFYKVWRKYFFPNDKESEEDV